MRLSAGILAPVLLAICTNGAVGGVLLEPTPAPDWEVSEWLNDSPGRIVAHRDKIVLINFFQMWCPGSQEFSIPLFERWAEEYADRRDVLVVSIHTVFEGHEEQTPDRLRRFVEEQGITIPVGIDVHDPPGSPVPITMDLYETGGTPHVAIVDKEGMLRFSHFGRFDPEPVERFITRILDETPTVNLKGKVRGGSPSKRKSRRKKPPKQQRDTSPPRPDRRNEPGSGQDADGKDESREDPDREEEPEDPAKPDAELSGSYKLRFEQLSKSCGDLAQPVEVITQISVLPDQIVATFSRPFLGVRKVTAQYDPAGSHFEANLQQQAQEKGGVTVDLSLQLSGRFSSIVDPPQLEYDFYLDERSEDGSLDCTIEGRGGGSRFRSR